MREFDLPLLDRNMRVRDAFRPMITQQTSGIVVVSYEEPKLVSFADLEIALSFGQESLANVKSEIALSLFDNEPSQAFVQLQTHGRKFGILRYTGNMAHVLSASQQYASIYLSAPPGSVCTNPADPHFYPPNHLDAKRPHQCILCPFSVP
jgi:hypothetical protein